MKLELVRLAAAPLRMRIGCAAHLLALALPALALMIAAPVRASDKVPDWVGQAAATPLPAGSEHARAVVLLEDKLLTIDPSGKNILRYREVIKIQNPRGRGYAQPVAWSNADSKLLSFHVWSIGPDGHRYSVSDKEIVERGSEEWGILYDDVRYKTVSPPGADPGGIVAYEFTQQTPAYADEESWYFQNSVPTARSVFEIDLPQGWQQVSFWHHYAAVEATQPAPGRWHWELSNIPAINTEYVPLAPSEEALAGRMVAHFSADLPAGADLQSLLWTRIGEWYNNLAAPKSEGPAEIAVASRQLAAPSADFMVRIVNVAAFLQQKVRYVGIEIGIGGLIPHSAADVYRNRYGDCKDKATLLIAMLDAVGVRATWVMVDTHRGVVDPKTPSLAGNHMITAIEIPKGYENPRLQAVVTARTGRRYLIFDPTNPYVPIGLLPTYLQGGYGELVAGADSQVIALPVLRPTDDTVEHTAKFDLTADGVLKGRVTVSRLGASSDSLRFFLTTSSEKDKRKSLEDSLREDFSSFQLGTETIDNAASLDKQLIVHYDVTADSYAKTAGDLLLVRPRILSSDAIALNDEPRKYPIQFAAIGDWRDSFDVEIPVGYSIDEVPDPVNVDTDFASYRSEVKAEGRTLHYDREYRVKELELPADQYQDLRKFEGQINADENRNAVLKKQ